VTFLTAEEAEAYFRSNYFDAFVRGPGAETLFQVMRDFGKPGTWLDVGSGPATLFWSLAMPEMTEITAVDLSHPALEILRGFAASGKIPVGYREAAAFLGVPIEHLQSQRKALQTMLAFDVFRPWDALGIGLKFDNITAIGVFSLAGSAEGFAQAIGFAARRLRQNGRLIGANWILTEAHGQRRCVDNSYLKMADISRACDQAGLICKVCKWLPTPDDPDYTGLFIYCMAKP
jgi:SAM-dependent methyltransferase